LRLASPWESRTQQSTPAPEELWRPSRGHHQKGGQQHCQQKVLETLAILHPRIGPRFHTKVDGLIDEGRGEHDDPRPPAGERLSEHEGGGKLNEDASDDVDGVVTESCRPLEEELPFVPGPDERVSVTCGFFGSHCGQSRRGRDDSERGRTDGDGLAQLAGPEDARQ